LTGGGGTLEPPGSVAAVSLVATLGATECSSSCAGVCDARASFMLGRSLLDLSLTL
jgi:hypothetical protein